MPDVLLFGATGYTGRLTADALARRNISFAVAGRDRAKLEALAEKTGATEVRVAQVGDVAALAEAADDVRVLITCVGPFVELGDTAVEAALRARVHYVDSTGEGPFIEKLIERHDDRARDARIAMAPAMGFDEVPSDVAATLAVDGLERPELILTYAVPTQASTGTVRSALNVVTSTAPWIVDGRRVPTRAGEHHRWAPMPPPLGPRSSISAPLAECYLAPLHLELRTFKVFMTAGAIQRLAATYGIPALRTLVSIPRARRALEEVLRRVVPEPDNEARSQGRWTILAEARAGSEWRNVALAGRDVYGLTAEFLAAAATVMAQDGYDAAGVLAPVQAVGADVLHKELLDQGVSIQTFEPT